MAAKLPILLLNTAQLLWALPPNSHQGFCPWTPRGDFRPPDPLVRPPMFTKNRCPWWGSSRLPSSIMTSHNFRGKLPSPSPFVVDFL